YARMRLQFSLQLAAVVREFLVVQRAERQVRQRRSRARQRRSRGILMHRAEQAHEPLLQDFWLRPAAAQVHVEAGVVEFGEQCREYIVAAEARDAPQLPQAAGK